MGIVAFDRLRPGTYLLYAQRVLSRQEADLAGGTVRAFGDGRIRILTHIDRT